MARWVVALAVAAGVFAAAVGVEVAVHLTVGLAGSIPFGLMFLVGTAAWAATDSAALGMRNCKGGIDSPLMVFLGVVALWIVCFPKCLVIRGELVDGELAPKAGFFRSKVCSVCGWRLDFRRELLGLCLPCHSRAG